MQILIPSMGGAARLKYWILSKWILYEDRNFKASALKLHILLHKYLKNNSHQNDDEDEFKFSLIQIFK